MDTIFTLGDAPDDVMKVNMDELYEKKKQHDLNTLTIFNKILNRIHNKIKTVSRFQINNQFCWYVIPEMIIGVPKYDHTSCTAYIIDHLRNNGFLIKYTHPNLLFISWKNWVPSYVRNEIKKKTGIIVDGYGKTIDKTNNNSANNTNNNEDDSDPNLLMFKNKKIPDKENKTKEFKSIDSYKPSGNLVYNNNLFKKIVEKLN